MTTTPKTPMTTPKKEDDDKNTITTWSRPNEMLQSQYGNVTYREWCELEKARMLTHGRKVVVVELDGMIALARP